MAVDPYLVLEKFLDRGRIPRLLSTVDFGLSSVQPEALLPLEGDFNKDGKPDLALSGVYTLPGKTPDYFLLVVGDSESRKPEQLFLKAGTRPFYLHKPATTGEGDPGDQAFSASLCINCSTGTDFRWDPVSRTFQEAPWTEGKRLQTVLAKNIEVDPKVADIALQVAGRLPDVKNFVDELGRRGSQLVTKVEPLAWKGQDRARVLIYERSQAGDELYDSIDVDTTARRVVKRGGSVPPPSASPAEPAAPDTSQ